MSEITNTYFEDRQMILNKLDKLEQEHNDNLSYIISLSISVSKLEKELEEYKKYVENKYVKIPVKMNQFRKLLFRIMFGRK